MSLVSSFLITLPFESRIVYCTSYSTPFVNPNLSSKSLSFISPKSPCIFGPACNALDSFSASAPRFVVVACICFNCSLSDAVLRLNESRLSSIDFFISAITSFKGAIMEFIWLRLAVSSSSERCFNRRSVVVPNCSCTSLKRSANCLSNKAIRSSFSRSFLRFMSSSRSTNCRLVSSSCRSCSIFTSANCLQSISASRCFTEISLDNEEILSEYSLLFFWFTIIITTTATSTPAIKYRTNIIIVV